MESYIAIIAAFVIFLAVSAGVVVILWIAMPFSVFGVKDLMKKTIEEQEKTNRFLKTLVEAVDRESKAKEDRTKDEPLVDKTDKNENIH